MNKAKGPMADVANWGNKALREDCWRSAVGGQLADKINAFHSDASAVRAQREAEARHAKWHLDSVYAFEKARMGR